MQQHLPQATYAATARATNLWTRPILGSDTFGWNGLVARRYLDVQPAHVALPALNDHVIIVTVRGGTRIDGTMERPVCGALAAPGSLFLTPRGTPSEWTNARSVDLLHLYVQPELLPRLLAASGNYTPERLELRELAAHADPLLEQLALGLLAELGSPQPAGPLYANTLIQAIGAHLLRHYSNVPPRGLAQLAGRGTTLSRVELRRLCAYIHDHLAEDLTLEQLAAVAHLSAHHLARVFKRATGLSIHQYVVQQRIAAAKQLLRQGHLRIAEVAIQVGFHDHAHLTRQFTRLVGVPPSVFRQGATHEPDADPHAA